MAGAYWKRKTKASANKAPPRARCPCDGEARVNNKAAGRITAVANGSLSVCGAKRTISNQIAVTKAAMIAWVREIRAPKNHALVTIDSDARAAASRGTRKAPVPPGAIHSPSATGPVIKV